MDWQTILTAAVGVGTSIVGWFVRDIKADIKEATIKQDRDSRALQALQLDVAKNYVTHADMSDVKESLQRMNDKLDRLIERQ